LPSEPRTETNDFWGDGAARPQTKPHRKSRLPLAAALLLAFVLFACLGFFLAGGIVAGLPSGQAAAEIPAAPVEKHPQVFLLTGSDQRENEAARADTIMVAFLDPETKQVSLLSIPRDTYVAVPGHGQTKINHAHAYGGQELLAETVEDFLGVKIDHFVEVNFRGFAGIVDALGGVEIDVERDMYYAPENINLKKGLQVLNGEDALGYVRWRGDGRADLGRIERQQKFLKALADQALSLNSILKIPQLVEEVTANVKTDLGAGEILNLARTFKDADPSAVEAVMLPGQPFWLNGVSYYRADEDEKEALMQRFYNNRDEETPPSPAGES